MTPWAVPRAIILTTDAPRATGGWLVLCDDFDVSARWTYEGLRERRVPVELVLTSVLSGAVRWAHRVGPAGASAEVVLPDGRMIATESVRGTLNRVVGLWPPAEFLASPDGDYAVQELLAMYLSLLQCLPAPVLNRPTPQGLSGRLRYSPDWFVLAARAGFVTIPYAASTRDDAPPGGSPLGASGLVSADRHTVIVAAGQVFGDPISAAAAAAACRLAALAQVELLGLQLATAPDGAAWFESADLYPDLRAGGEQFLDHLGRLAPAVSSP